MSNMLPKLDRARLLEELWVEADRTVNDVADALDNASAGRVIRDREEKTRDALDHFRH